MSEGPAAACRRHSPGGGSSLLGPVPEQEEQVGDGDEAVFLDELHAIAVIEVALADEEADVLAQPAALVENPATQPRTASLQRAQRLTRGGAFHRHPLGTFGSGL